MTIPEEMRIHSDEITNELLSKGYTLPQINDFLRALINSLHTD